jgi:hypothetical protein
MNPAIRYGLMNGGLAILWSLMMYVTGLNRTDSGQYINFLGALIPLIFMYYAIRDFRLGPGHGFISFRKAFGEAFKVGIIGGIIGTFYMVLYMNVIDPGYQDYLMQQQEIRLADMGLSQEEIDRQIERGAKWQTPGMFIMWGILGSVIISAVFGLIMAAIFKKPNPEEIA